MMALGGEAFGRCLGHEDGTFMNRIISAFIKEAPESLWAIPPCEDTENNHAGTLVLEFWLPEL